MPAPESLRSFCTSLAEIVAALSADGARTDAGPTKPDAGDSARAATINLLRMAMVA